jgi:hypothetical protein
MSEYGKDFVWMQRKGEEPVRVDSDPAVISKCMVAGFSQVDPPKETKKKD